jgi:hypothetical protein
MKVTTQQHLFRAMLVIGFCFFILMSARSQTTVTLNPIADTDTQSDNASGTNPTLNASLYNFIFLKFNLGSITGTVTSARVRIYRGASGAATLNVSNASPDS